MNIGQRQAIKKRESIDLLFDLLIKEIGYHEPRISSPCILNVMHIVPEKEVYSLYICNLQTIHTIKSCWNCWIVDYLAISRRILADKDNPKDSRMYAQLRSVLYGSFKRMVLEDIDGASDLMLGMSFLSANLVAVGYRSSFYCSCVVFTTRFRATKRKTRITKS